MTVYYGPPETPGACTLHVHRETLANLVRTSEYSLMERTHERWLDAVQGGAVFQDVTPMERTHERWLDAVQGSMEGFVMYDSTSLNNK